MQSKERQTEILLKKIKKIIEKAIKQKRFEKAMAAIAFMGDYLYNYNQFYTEDELERYLSIISLELKNNYKTHSEFYSQNKIIFYDGFGLDTRGTVLIYLNALGLNNYNVVYITSKEKENKIPTIIEMCEKYGFERKFIDTKSYLKWTKQLSDILFEVQPRAAFFYSTPNDVSGIVAFSIFEGVFKRYFIDLTDHAFWLGKNSADYFLGSRDMSASLQYFQRGIKKEKLIKLDVNVIVNEEQEHKDLPFNPLTREYIFSGGSLYKTLGDPQNIYYKIVDYILSKHNNITFLYAGSGDDSELKKIIDKYPERAYLIDERKDFYYLIQNCKLYLNTYPMFGGMMMRYCGLAQKIPLTLRHGNDSDGLLLNQSECKIEYISYEELISDMDKLLMDEEYRKKREALLENSVMTEESFKENIRSLIEKQKTDFEHQYLELSTKEFRKEYYKRFDYNKQMRNIASKRNLSLVSNFPFIFIKSIITKAYNKLEKGFGGYKK